MNFVKTNIFNVFASVILYAINMLIGIIEARILGPTQLGHFQIFITTQTIIVTIFSIGLGQASIYFLNTNKVSLEDIISTTLKAEMLIGLVAFFLLFLPVLFIPSYFGSISLLSLFLYSLGSVALLFTTAMRPLLLAKLQILKNQLVQYIVSVSTLILICIVLLLRHTLSTDILLIIVGFANILSAVILYSYFHRYFHFKTKFRYPLFKSIAKFGVQVSGNNIASILIANLPVYALSWFLMDGFNEVGLFSRAISVCTIATFTNKAIGPLLYAKFTNSTTDENRENSKLVATVFLLFNFVMAVIIAVSATFIIKILYGEQYLNAVPTLRVLCITLIFSGVNEITFNLLSSIGKPVYIFYNLVIGLIVLIPLLYLFITYFGGIGAAYAIVLSTAVTSLLLVKDLRKYILIDYSDFFLLKSERIFRSIALIKKSIK